MFNTYLSLLFFQMWIASSRSDSCSLCPFDNNNTNITLEKKLNIVTNDGFMINNCSHLESFVTSLEAESQECSAYQALGTICGCPLHESACRLCKDGSRIPAEKQNRSISTVLQNNHIEGTPFLHTCEMFEAYMHSEPQDSAVCEEAQLISTYCGCPDPENACLFCSSLDDVEDLSKTPPFEDLPTFGNFPTSPRVLDFNHITCELMQEIGKHMYEGDSFDCQKHLQYNGYLCGCPFLFRRRQKILEWLPRVSASMSFLGSAFIAQDILKSRKKYVTTYHQIILGMSVVDMLSSIAWALSVVPLPVEDAAGFGAKGNDATCIAQGFFIEFGLTSPFFNLALSIYYLLVIKYGWKEDRISKKRIYFLGLPPLFGSIFAFAAIPHYGPDVAMCYVNQSDHHNYRLPIVFLFLPVFIVIVFATIAVIMVYLSVREKERISSRWSMRTDHHPGLSRKVFWQSLWYLASFYVSWPIVIIVPFVDTNYYRAFGYLCLVIFFAPFQGFLNFIVYTHPRLQQYHFFKRISASLLRSRLQHGVATIASTLGPSSENQDDHGPTETKESNEPGSSTISTTSSNTTSHKFKIQEPSAYIAKSIAPIN